MSSLLPHDGESGPRARVVGLISDTHGQVRESCMAALAGVELILHAGDVGGLHVIEYLSGIAPVRAVRGNIDPPRLHLPLELTCEIGGLVFHVSHGDELGQPTPQRLLAAYLGDILVYGHTHRPAVVESEGRVVVNPGAAGPRRFSLEPSVARVTIQDGRASVELVAL
jgi:uncharacterized protein